MLETLHEESGLCSTLQENPSLTHLATTPQHCHEWNTPLPGNLESLAAPYDDLSLALSAVSSALYETALLAQAITKINSLAGELT